MDGIGLDLTIVQFAVFLVATFAAALVAGLAGFAFGLVAAATWLHVLSPVATASLIIGYGLIVQGLAVWKLRHALSWKLLWPFLLGAALGVPLGAFLLTWVNPQHLRLGIGAFLVLYSIYALARPPLKPVATGIPADIGVGFLNGALGGMTGFAGIIVTIWSGIRGWPKDVQRAVFQPIGVATFAMSAVWIGASGAVSASTLKLFLVGLPFLIAGTWLGLKLYGRLDEAGFRRVVLILLLISGAALVVAPLFARLR
jgi:uncharacterized membrane protein YfcA